MDETETRNTNDPIILKEELDIDINDLFTIDFKNLKIFLTTILQNQNKISHKMNTIETNLDDKERKISRRFSNLNKKIKSIENTLALNGDKEDNEENEENEENEDKEDKEDKEENEDNKDKFNDVNKGKASYENKEHDEENHDNEKNKENEYFMSNSNIEIKASKRNETQTYESSNNNFIEKEREKEKEKEKENENENEKEKDDNLEIKNIDKDQDKDKEIKKDIIINDTKTQINKKPIVSDKEIKETKNAISEEEFMEKSEEEKEKENLNNKKDNINELSNKSKKSKYEDPYRNVPVRRYSNYTLDDLLTQFPKLLMDFDQLKNRVIFFEKKMKATEKESKIIAFKTMDNSSSEDVQYLKLMIKDLQNRNLELDKENENMKKEIEELQVKMKDLNIFEIIQNSQMDQGNIDITKALVMTLEQKVFKKTALIDEKIKHLDESMNKLAFDQKNLKNISEILKLSNEDNKRMIKNLEELENKSAEDSLNLSNEVNNITNYIKKVKEFELRVNETLKNNGALFEKLQNNSAKCNKKIKELEEMLEDNEPKKPGIDKQLFQKFKNEVSESIKDLKRKNGDMEKEIEYFKHHPDLIKAKEDLVKIQKEIVGKVNKTDFLDLKDKFNMQNVDNINLSDSIDKIQELANKNKNEIGFFLKKLESLSAAQVSTRTLLNDLIKKQQDVLFDTSKYLEITAFNKFLEAFQKEKENNDNNFASVNKLLTEMAESLKSKSGTEDMKIFEQMMNNKLEELKLYSIRKFADKIETTRNIKYLDSQIRHIIEVYIKKSEKSESWLIAKKPLGGYTCASCESYLGELKNTKEFTPWSKYPNREDKNYRCGNGFSRMLNMLNVDFKTQLDAIKDNAYESDNEGRNSAEPKSTHNRRFSKNLSSANVYTHINSRNNNNTSTNNNRLDIFPKINLNRRHENNNNNNNNSNSNINDHISIDFGENGKNMKINESNIQSENEKMKDNTSRRYDEPHVIKIYRKNKIKSIEMNGKDKNDKEE